MRRLEELSDILIPKGLMNWCIVMVEHTNMRVFTVNSFSSFSDKHQKQNSRCNHICGIIHRTCKKIIIKNKGGANECFIKQWPSKSVYMDLKLGCQWRNIEDYM
jgi:hypothetical protein